MSEEKGEFNVIQTGGYIFWWQGIGVFIGASDWVYVPEVGRCCMSLVKYSVICVLKRFG